MKGDILGGLKVVVSCERPRYRLPDGLPLPPDFRAEFNAWALEFFGTWNLLPDGQVLIEERRGIVHMNARTLAAMKAAMPPENPLPAAPTADVRALVAERDDYRARLATQCGQTLAARAERDALARLEKGRQL
jgi:hypothetical protein